MPNSRASSKNDARPRRSAPAGGATSQARPATARTPVNLPVGLGGADATDPRDKTPALSRETEQSHSGRDRARSIGWRHYFLYPVRAWPILLGLAVVLTYLSTTVPFLLPKDFDSFTELVKNTATSIILATICQTVLGYAFVFLFLVLVSSTEGEMRPVYGVGRDCRHAVAGLSAWLVCFLAGPILPAAVAVWYVLRAEEPGPLDQIVIAELVFVAVIYWLLGFVAVGQSGRLKSANPLYVADVAMSVGWRALLLIATTGALAVAGYFSARYALGELALNLERTWLVLGATSFGMLYGATFLMRYLGLTCHHKGISALGSGFEEASAGTS